MSDTDILLTGQFRLSVEANLDRDPVRIALDKRLPHAALVASQVKYLRRAERKLPSYFAARCLLPPLAFEQSSSERTAARKDYTGGLAVDLTCGLGVDSLYLARHFDRVIAIERDAELAAIARENFRRLGTRNVEVVNTSAEEYLSLPGLRPDLIYADPDRRNSAGRKMVRIEDCSPDIVSLLPLIRGIAPRLAVKLSPLFDVAEVFRIFGSHTRVEVVSLCGECKEIVAESAEDISVPAVRAVAIGTGEVEYPFDDGGEIPLQAFEPEKYRYLVTPDVALQKARLARRYFATRLDYIDSDNGYGFSVRKPEGAMGKVSEIAGIEPFDPKALKRRLSGEGIKSIDILKRNFPLSSADIARGAGVRQGGGTSIAFTRTAGRLWQIALRSHSE